MDQIDRVPGLLASHNEGAESRLYVRRSYIDTIDPDLHTFTLSNGDGFSAEYEVLEKHDEYLIVRPYVEEAR
jgi:hypothetical protein